MKSTFVTKGDSRVTWDAANDWFVNAVDCIYESVGVEMGYDEDSSGNGSRMLSNEETRVGSQLIWIYRKTVYSSTPPIPTAL